jgi:hypothetical protein
MHHWWFVLLRCWYMMGRHGVGGPVGTVLVLVPDEEHEESEGGSHTNDLCKQGVMRHLAFACLNTMSRRSCADPRRSAQIR